jgi:hypothetical protein
MINIPIWIFVVLLVFGVIGLIVVISVIFSGGSVSSGMHPIEEFARKNGCHFEY